jgi:hypothetical protein
LYYCKKRIDIVISNLKEILKEQGWPETATLLYLNPLKVKRICVIQEFSSHRAVNTFYLVNIKTNKCVNPSMILGILLHVSAL